MSEIPKDIDDIASAIVRAQFNEDSDPEWEMYLLISKAVLAERASLSSELDRLRGALEEIVKPVEFMRRRADAAGSKLDGFMAITLAKDPEYLRGIARAALSPDNSTQKKEGEI